MLSLSLRTDLPADRQCASKEQLLLKIDLSLEGRHVDKREAQGTDFHVDFFFVIFNVEDPVGSTYFF